MQQSRQGPTHTARLEFAGPDTFALRTHTLPGVKTACPRANRQKYIPGQSHRGAMGPSGRRFAEHYEKIVLGGSSTFTDNPSQPHYLKYCQWSYLTCMFFGAFVPMLACLRDSRLQVEPSTELNFKRMCSGHTVAPATSILVHFRGVYDPG